MKLFPEGTAQDEDVCSLRDIVWVGWSSQIKEVLLEMEP